MVDNFENCVLILNTLKSNRDKLEATTLGGNKEDKSVNKIKYKAQLQKRVPNSGTKFLKGFHMFILQTLESFYNLS